MNDPGAHPEESLAWRGPAMIGIAHRFADREAEVRYQLAMVGQNLQRLRMVAGVVAFLTVPPAALEMLGIWSSGASSSIAIGDRVFQVGLAFLVLLATRWLHKPQWIEAVSIMFGAAFVAARCIVIAGSPGLVQSSAAMVVGSVALLYFGLPVRLPWLAPLMALASGAMMAAWMTAASRAPAAILQLAEWILVINGLGGYALRLLRFNLRRIWAQTEGLRHLAMHDGLTGVANRRQYDAALGREWRDCATSGQPLSLIQLDVDFFKLLNDCVGHAAGDSSLRDLAVVLSGCLVRSGDLLARTGGEEFALLLPGTDAAGARAVALRISRAVREAEIAHPSSPLGGSLTVSLGVATAMPNKGGAAWELSALADRLVYAAKHEGRNRLVQAKLAEGDEEHARAIDPH